MSDLGAIAAVFLLVGTGAIAVAWARVFWRWARRPRMTFAPWDRSDEVRAFQATVPVGIALDPAKAGEMFRMLMPGWPWQTRENLLRDVERFEMLATRSRILDAFNGLDPAALQPAYIVYPGPA